MFYKINLFLREWEGYDRVYNFFKEKFTSVLLVKLILYIVACICIFFAHSTLLSALRVIIYIPLTVMEYFSGAIWREKDEKVSSISSYGLMILNFIIVILYSLKLIFHI